MKKKLAVAVLLLLALALAALAVRRLRALSGESGVIRVSGNIEAVEVELSFRLAGWVQSRPVDEGDAVKAGQLIAELDGRELAQQRDLALADERAVRALVAELEAGSRPEEVAAAEAAVRRAAAEAELARAELARAAQLRKDGAITAQELDVRRAADGAAAAAERQAQEGLKLVQAGPRKEAIEQARARAESARQAAAVAETRLGYARLASPVNGVVLTKAAEAGEYVSPGTPVVTVADLRGVYLRAYVNETDLGRVQLGQPVRVRTDTWPGKAYAGRVAFISAQAEFTPKNIQTAKERVKLVYRVKVDIANPEMELKPGMPADAEILAR